MKDTQKQFILNELGLYGEISRNTCLKNYITRLASMITVLKREGWQFEASYRDTGYGKDFVYKVIGRPQK